MQFTIQSWTQENDSCRFCKTGLCHLHKRFWDPKYPQCRIEGCVWTPGRDVSPWPCGKLHSRKRLRVNSSKSQCPWIFKRCVLTGWLAEKGTLQQMRSLQESKSHNHSFKNDFSLELLIIHNLQGSFNLFYFDSHWEQPGCNASLRMLWFLFSLGRHISLCMYISLYVYLSVCYH